MADLLLVSNRSGQVRRETLAGREYLVAPVVAIRAGILNGELVPLEEIGAFIEAWNGIPLPLGHPIQRGIPISANTPELEASLSVGRFWNAELVDDRLHGEVWVDIAKAQTIEGGLEVLQRLENDKGIEVSTAYYRDLEPTPGQLNGQRYAGIARNLRPDHLALLLNGIGACSWKDGCGVPRVNSSTETKNCRRLTGNQQQTDVMVALFPPDSAAASLTVTSEQLPEGAVPTPTGDLHLTLGYLGDLEKGDVLIEQGWLLERVMAFASNSILVRGVVNGVARFTNTDENGQQALVALFDCEYLPAWRNWLTDGLPIKRNHGFTPHITLAYLPADAPTPDIRPAPMEMVFDRIGVAWGGQVTLFPLQGEVQAVEANKSGFNPVALARNALRGLASVLGFPENEGRETDPTYSAAPVGGAHTEEVTMTKKAELIDKLIANKRCMLDKNDMELMSDTGLEKLLTALEKGGCPGSAPATDPAASPAANAAATATAELAIPQELQELSAALKEMGGVSGLKNAIAAVQANAGQRKAELVTELKANERCAFAEADLQAMSVDQLEKLATSLRPANYAGRGGPRGNAGSEGHQVPEPPKVIMGDLSA